MQVEPAEIEAKSNGINWTKFEEGSKRFISLEGGIKKQIKIEGVTHGKRQFVRQEGGIEEADALECRITMEDGQPCEKEMNVTSKRLARALKPHIMDGLPVIVTILKKGEKFNTQYEVIKG